MASDEMRIETAQKATRNGPNLFLCLLWFIFVGSWLSLIWSVVAWLLIVSIVGLPFGLVMLNRMPQITTLRSPLTLGNGERLPQPFWLWRMLYFLLIGWWFSFVWMTLAWSFGATLLGIPVAIWMWNRVPRVTTLARY